MIAGFCFKAPAGRFTHGKRHFFFKKCPCGKMQTRQQKLNLKKKVPAGRCRYGRRKRSCSWLVSPSFCVLFRSTFDQQEQLTGRCRHGKRLLAFSCKRSPCVEMQTRQKNFFSSRLFPALFLPTTLYVCGSPFLHP